MSGQTLEEFLAEYVSLQLANIRLSLNEIYSGRSPLDPQTLHPGLKRIGAQLERIERRGREHLEALGMNRDFPASQGPTPRSLEDVLRALEAEQEDMFGTTAGPSEADIKSG